MPMWTMIAAPLGTAVLLAVIGNRLGKKVIGGLACAALLFSFVVAWMASTPLLYAAFPDLAAGAGADAPPAAQVVTETLWSWFSVDLVSIEFALKLDALAALMALVVAGVGFLIFLYATAYMADDDDYARFFCYMSLFVAAMLTLVLADNLVLMYLGWEGVGVCSYLLIGFWYRDPAKAAAGRKAFIVTRIGDAALMIAMLMIALSLRTLQFDAVTRGALAGWPAGGPMATTVALLLLAGALGKSAQVPLQVWLPDAMAGPTPVSALLHAATMVTAGVYLVARTHELFLLAPGVLALVASIGGLTAFLAACAALFQNDIKRVLAYSTISQIGYMFAALGAGGFAAAMFHFLAHAFFKALLFLSAGNVTHCVHETDIRLMGGLRRSRALPGTAAVAAVGAASLAGIPLITSGFYSKDAILWSMLVPPLVRPGLLVLLLITAGLTSLYAFRWYFMIFSGPAGEASQQDIHRPRDLMLYPLLVLAAGALLIGFLEMPESLGGYHAVSQFLQPVFVNAYQRFGVGAGLPLGTEEAAHSAEVTLQAVSAALSLLGMMLAYQLYILRPAWKERLAESDVGRGIADTLRSGWGADALYGMVVVRPYRWIARALRHEPVDDGIGVITGSARLSHYLLALTQTGRIRTYAAGVTLGAILLLLSWWWR
ncbi:MAG: NADH-quinone oxidoreductase subunit L [Acidobacteriota bacterium]|jgi:NADH-quinone oxidoreductase subunit L